MRVVGAGSTGGEGGLDVANTFKPQLARGELHLIGATTLNEYQKHVEKDAALERRFQPVLVPEPTVEQTVTILRGLRDRLEAHHKVAISDEAISAAAELSDRYVTNRYLPDKAIDLIDQAAARVRLRGSSRPPDLQEAEAELQQLRRERDYAASRKKFDRAKGIEARIDERQKEYDQQLERWNRSRRSASAEVRVQDVARYEELKNDLLNVLRRLRPEFLNRIDEIIVFHGLDREHIKQIVGLQLERVKRTARGQGLTLEFDDSLLEHLADVGYQPEFGARELRRRIRSPVETSSPRRCCAGR